MIKTLALLLLILVLEINARNDPLSTLITYEEKQRSGADLDSNDYSLIPFRLSNTPQTFLIAPNVDQTISVEVVVHWISNTGLLRFPLFDLTQKVRMTIEEQTYGTPLQKPTLTKEFLTQTGFKVKIYAGKKYRIRLESLGKQVKLVEIAITHRQHTLPQLETVVKNHTNWLRLLQQMRTNLYEAQMRWASRNPQEDKQQEASSIWAWMSGIEMFSLLAFVGMQIFLFQRFSLPSSVI